MIERGRERGGQFGSASIWRAVLVVLFLTLAATAAQAAISGSKHDFSGKGWGSDEICIFCHSPHNAKQESGATIAPLWYHTMSTATYGLYTSPSLKQTALQPRGPSKLCLSCHDGSVAIDSFGNRSGTEFMTGSANVGTSLADDHPISIKWNHSTFKVNPACATCHSGPHGNFTYVGPPFYGTPGNMYMECGSCHEPHNKYTQYPRMLRRALTGSAICLACHGK